MAAAATAAAAAGVLLLGLLCGRPVLAAGDSPTIAVASSAPTADFGSDVQFTAQVSGPDGPGTGTVDFTIDGVDLAPGVGLDSGTGRPRSTRRRSRRAPTRSRSPTPVTATTRPVRGRSHPTRSSITLQARPWSASDVHPSVVWAARDVHRDGRAALGGMPTGTVDFTDGGADLGQGTLDGSGHGVDHGSPRPARPSTRSAPSTPAMRTSRAAPRSSSRKSFFPRSRRSMVSPDAVVRDWRDVRGFRHGVGARARLVGTPVGAVTVSDGTGATCGIPMSTVPSGSCSLLSTTAGSQDDHRVVRRLVPAQTYGFLRARALTRSSISSTLPPRP